MKDRETRRRAPVVVKLGGSVVTHKGGETLALRGDTVSRLSSELLAAAGPLVLVHGAGSFGHQIVKRTGLHRGLTEGPQSRLDLCETQRLQYDLDSQVASHLIEAGVPAFPCQASASAVMRSGVLRSMDLRAPRQLLDQGLVPLLYGVPAVDETQGCSILSGDQIAPYVAVGLHMGEVIHGTDVDGVYDGDPRASHARRFDRIGPHNWSEVRRALSGSKAVDVTGGMAGKVEALVGLAKQGITSRVVDATIAGRLESAILGEDVGTLISWEEVR